MDKGMCGQVGVLHLTVGFKHQRTRTRKSIEGMVSHSLRDNQNVELVAKTNTEK